MSRSESTAEYDLNADTEYVRAVLRIVPPSDVSCAVTDAASRRGEVTQELVDDDRRCRAEISTRTDARLLESTVDDGCVCLVFRRYNCVASVDAVEGEALLVSVSTPDRDELASIVTALHALGATVTLERASSGNADAGEHTFELAVGSLTKKQRETLKVAVESGYYDRPRRTDLGELADRFDVSRSAVSQRLSAVEAKLVRELAHAMEDVDEPEAEEDQHSPRFSTR